MYSKAWPQLVHSSQLTIIVQVDVKLHIFSYLDARSLCRACGVSRDWNQLLWDDLLWRQRLAVDRLTWSQVSHVTNPQTYTEAASDLAYKEM